MNELLNELVYTLEEKKKLEAKEKELKEQIEVKLIDSNESKIENDDIKIALVPETETTTFDMTAFKKQENELYNALFNDYQKTSKRKAYLKVTVK